MQYKTKYKYLTVFLFFVELITVKQTDKNLQSHCYLGAIARTKGFIYLFYRKYTTIQIL